MLRQKTRRKTTSLRTLRTNAFKTFTLCEPTESHPGFVKKKKKKVGKKAHNKQPNTHNSANKTAALITAA